MVNSDIIVVSNDIVPGQALPVAAPGLRSWGIAEGLRAHGWNVTLAVVDHIVKKRWRRATPPPTRPGTVVVPPRMVADLIASREARAVIITNSNQIDALPEDLDTPIIYDFFAPKMLELAYQHDTYPVEQLTHLRERKIRALSRAAGVIINGAKKRPYVLAWLLQTDHDIRAFPMEVMGMALPTHSRSDPSASPIRLSITGYIQPWSRPGEWTRYLEQLLRDRRCTLELSAPRHWGGQIEHEEPHPEFERLLRSPGVESFEADLFSRFQERLTNADVSLDLFARNLEREFAMVTRTAVALACGVAVVHPPFTELSSMIETYDAGWIVDPSDTTAVHSTLEAIVDDPDQVTNKRANARRLAQERLEPRAATSPLITLFDRLSVR